MKFQTVLKKKFIKLFIMGCLLAVPAISFCQPGPGDDNPDVPFDDNMNLIFLAIGLVFAVIIIGKKLRKSTIA